MDPAAEWLDAMVRTQLASRDIHGPRVLETMRRVDRAAFVPASSALADPAAASTVRAGTVFKSVLRFM